VPGDNLLVKAFLMRLQTCRIEGDRVIPRAA